MSRDEKCIFEMFLFLAGMLVQQCSAATLKMSYEAGMSCHVLAIKSRPTSTAIPDKLGARLSLVPLRQLMFSLPNNLMIFSLIQLHSTSGLHHVINNT